MRGKCGMDREEIIDYINGETEAPGKKEKIKKHLKECGECAAEAEKYRNIIKSVKTIKADFSEDVWAMQRGAIIRKLREEKKESLPARFLKFVSGVFSLRRAGLAFLLFAAFGAGLFYYGSYRQGISLEKERKITRNLDFYESLEVLERLDYYKKIAREGGIL